MSDIIWLSLVLAGLTYATRFGGHVILSRFKRINPRLEAALDAVPAAVITALLASLRYSMLGVVISATATVALLRYLF